MFGTQIQQRLSTFDSAMNTFGFDWANSDSSIDTLELIVGDQVFEFGLSGQSGFFGIVATEGNFSKVQFSDTVGGSYLQYGSIDNVRYGNISPRTVPTPTAILPNFALLGLNALRRCGDRQTNG